MATGAAPRLGIVLPTYGHSGLVAEGLESLLGQRSPPPFVVIAIDDGDPDPETGRVLAGYAAADPRIVHIRRRNGGLSAARNTAIAYLLRAYPEIEAVFFLDSDNRLEPWALARMMEGLEASPAADWLYPDIDMFGLDGWFETGGAYPRLAHATDNMCEAGSVVRRRVLDAGVRFNETARDGYEDWAFWLTAREYGFTGAHLPHMGLRYRKRPESKLWDPLESTCRHASLSIL